MPPLQYLLRRVPTNPIARRAVALTSQQGLPFRGGSQARSLTTTPRDSSAIRREFVFFPVWFIPQQHVVLRERFGKYVETLFPGLRLAIPLIDTLTFVRLSENVYAVTSQEAITKDNAPVKADGVVYYQIKDPIKAAYDVNNMLEALLNLVITNLRSVMGDMTLDELLSGRQEINRKLGKVIALATEPWGIIVTRIEIKTIEPDPGLVNAMNKQMTAERNRRAEVLAAEAQRSKIVLAAEAEKQAKILDAQARLEVARLEAEARAVQANAEANALRVVGEAIRKTPEVANFTVAKETAAAWRRLAESRNGSRVLFLPTGTTSIVAPLAAAAEMLKGVPNESESQAAGDGSTVARSNSPGKKQ